MLQFRCWQASKRPITLAFTKISCRELAKFPTLLFDERFFKLMNSYTYTGLQNIMMSIECLQECVPVKINIIMPRAMTLNK